MYHVIVNPASRTGKGKKLWSDIEPVLCDNGVDYKVHFSKKAGNVIELAREITSSELSKESDEVIKLIVLGGDGTMNEALQGISDFSRVQIGYVPTGSSNDLSRDLKLPDDPKECLLNIINCKTPHYMDLGCLQYNEVSREYSSKHEENIISKRYFDVSMGIGFDAAICEEAMVSPLKTVLNKLGLGKLIYLVVALKQILFTKNCDCFMTIDDNKKIKLPNFLFVTCMVHQYEGGGFMFCPHADYTDGILEICTVNNMSKFNVLRALPSATKGKHLKFKGINKYSGKKVKLETSAPCWVHTDGEVTMKSTSVTITCEKEKIQLLK